MEPEKKRKRLNQSIDEQLHRRLKAWAAAQGMRLPEAIEALLRQSLPPPNGHAS